MTKKTKEMFSKKDMADCTPLGALLRTLGTGFGEFQGLCKKHGGLVTAPQAAAVLGVTKQRIYQMINSGVIEPIECLGKSYVGCNEINRLMDDRAAYMAARRGEPSEGMAAVFHDAVEAAKKQT